MNFFVENIQLYSSIPKTGKQFTYTQDLSDCLSSQEQELYFVGSFINKNSIIKRNMKKSALISKLFSNLAESCEHPSLRCQIFTFTHNTKIKDLNK